MAKVRIVVEGRVQGVFFRASTRARAQSLGVRGWVRNRPDGSVEVVAEGDDDATEQLVEFCRRGPPDARVDAIVVQRGDSAGDPGAGSEFEVRR